VCSDTGRTTPGTWRSVSLDTASRYPTTPSRLDDDVVGAPDGDLAGDERDHASTAAASGAWLAWQTATASASAAWSGLRQRPEREHRGDHPRDLCLVRAPRRTPRP
jgi:hypothetical protein